MRDEKLSGRSFGIIAMGASAGGVTAIRKILAQLDLNFRTPIAIVQHMTSTARININLVYHPGESRKLAEVEDKMKIEPSFIYMSTPNYHMTVEKEGYFSLSQDEPVRFARPSIDVFFDSVAQAYGPLALGILLTGASSDGAEGLANISRSGGGTIVQDPKDAEYDTMPTAALEIFQPDMVLSVSEIPFHLNRTKFFVSELAL
jgi:two-component system, chemotaxis family, protein-glutamate methylesterase/glutaminase